MGETLVAGLFYFTVIVSTANVAATHGQTMQTYGPFHKQYACEKVLEGKVAELKELVSTYTAPAVTFILATPCQASVEMEAVWTSVVP